MLVTCQIDPDARRRRLTALVNAASLAREAPAVYVVEDAHWIDEVSESMLADFLTVIPQTPSLVLVTYRPEYDGALTRVHGAQTIALAPLSDSETAALVSELLGPDPSVRRLGQTIAERAAGNPFFAEEIVRENCGRFATFRGEQEPLEIIAEEIGVKGGDPVRFDVRLTRHGPLVSDAINAINAARPGRASLAPLALRWTALDADDSTLEAFLKLNAARNWSDFTGALRDFIVPSQNFVYADVDGHIGYYAPGRIPIRARGDGTVPVDGWTGENEWTGWVPFEKLPHVADPPQHFIVTANHRPAGNGYPYVIGSDWPEPYRAARITELLAGLAKATPADFARIQRDTVSLHARALLPLLLEHVRPDSEADRQAVETLRDWNGDAAGSSSAAPIFEAWFLRLADDSGGRRTAVGFARELRRAIQLRHSISRQHPLG